MATVVATAHDQFQCYVTRNLRYLTQQIAQAVPLPAVELRRQALHSLSYALGAPACWPATRELLLTLAPKMEQAGHRYDWLPYLEQATRFSEQLGDQATAAELYLQQGMIQRLLSDFAAAKIHLQRSHDLWQTLSDPRNQARALNELAWVAYLQDQTQVAATQVQAALALLPAADPERAMSYRVQGMVAIAHARWAEAENLHRQALAIFEAQGDQRKRAWSLQNLAYALRGQERFAEAVDYYEQAAALLQELGDRYNWSTVQMNLGLTYHHAGSPEIAVRYYDAARSVPQGVLDTFHLARLTLNTAVALLTLSQYPQAEKAFLEAIRLHTAIGAIPWRLNDMDGLAMTYIGWQKYDQAILVLQQAKAELPTVADTPNYNYLYNSLQQHWEEARRGLQATLETL